MKLALILLSFAPALAFAERWTGALVDSKCYDAEERNIAPTNTDGAVNVDRSAEIDYCHPGAKTKVFAIVDFDGTMFKLDTEGNAKASALVRAHPQKSRYRVEVKGKKGARTLKVESISPAP